ncbi:unnamed protein product [Alopecurus aequalis]
MGSCVSRSPASAETAGSSGRRVPTAKVVDIDGFMTQYEAPVTAREALRDHRGASVFLCSSDELRFDAPPRALADEEPLQPGWLYFMLPVYMLHLALSGHEMAALAVRASSALAVAGGVASPPRRKNVARVAGANGKQRKTARVAPLIVDDHEADGGWVRHANGKYVVARKTVHDDGDETVVKSRKQAGYRSRGNRRRAGTPKLSPILEADEF